MKLTAYNAIGSRILKGWHIQNEQGHRVASIDGSTLSPEKEYELAQLIAAAPELAEALEWLLREYLHVVTVPADDIPQVKAARATLQKAGVTL